MAETLVALLALAPFLAGVPLLGKQLDIKQKTYDATRYVVWERTVWSSAGTSNRKSDQDIALELRDRAFGSPLAGLIAPQALRSQGVTENALWRDVQQRRLLDYDSSDAPVSMTSTSGNTPVDVGYWLVPGIAHGAGALGEIQQALQLRSLGLDRRSYATSSISVGLRPVLQAMGARPPSLGEHRERQHESEQLVQTGSGAILSDSWSPRDEAHLRDRVDDVTTNELLEQLELAGRPIGLQAMGKGRALYGEGQFGWEPDLRPRSTVLPPAYIQRR